VDEEEKLQAFKAIGLAADLENQGYELYTTAAKLVSDPLARQMFEKLAEDELQHLAAIKEIQDELVESLDISRYDLAEALGAGDFPELPLSGVFEHLKKWTSSIGDFRMASELDALGAALVAEINAIRHYSDLLLACTSEVAQKTYRRLIAEEKKHFEILTRRTEQVVNGYLT